MEKFLIPVYYNDQIYIEGDLIKPKGGVLAEAQKAKNDMMGIVKIVGGCLASISSLSGESITNKELIENIVKKMPFQTAEYLAMKIFAKEGEGAIEQIVSCPRCKDKYIYEYHSEDLDNRIFFDDLKTIEYEIEGAPTVEIRLSEPITIKDAKTKNILEMIESITMRFPNMNDGIIASNMFESDLVRRQYQMYVSAITHINNRETTASFKNTWGMFIFDRLFSDDLKNISNDLSGYGIMKRLHRTCGKCDKNFEFIVNTSAFFE